VALSLIELLVAIAVIAILAAFECPSLKSIAVKSIAGSFAANHALGIRINVCEIGENCSFPHHRS
jgi:prepilin-type N-terminal cleavage/methylation domain-containing protein